MMKTLKLLLITILTALSSVSCIRDEIEPCPDLKVTLSVKDKNFANVDQVELEEARPEDLPFRNYISNLHWSLRDRRTGRIVDESPMISVDSDGETVELNISSKVPHGQYRLTVWGELHEPNALTEAKDRLEFHPGNGEGDDVYMASIDIDYDAWNYEFTAAMERTKGKLIIEKLNLPEEMNESVKTVNNLYGSVDHQFNYSGVTTVRKQASMEPAPQIVSRTLLSPTIDGMHSMLHTVFRTASRAGEAEGTLVPKDVEIRMKRNELTVVRYIWDPERKDFNIFILIDAGWKEIVNLEVEIK